jgi:crossover junction endodeoxyribonuclease RusA
MTPATTRGREGAVVIRVVGTPAPQGSHRAFVNRRTGRAVVTDDSPATRPWRTDVRAAAMEAMERPMTGPIMLRLLFLFVRPKAHRGKGGLLPSAPRHKVTRPDLDKVQRSTLDALTGIAYLDDAQVVAIFASKAWADIDMPGAVITIEPLTEVPGP